MQTNLQIFHEVPEIAHVPDHLVHTCKTWRDAVRLTMNQARTRMTDSDWAESIGVSKGYFSTALNGSGQRVRHLNPDQIHRIQVIAGNCAYTQWAYWRLMRRQEMANQLAEWE